MCWYVWRHEAKLKTLNIYKYINILTFKFGNKKDTFLNSWTTHRMHTCPKNASIKYIEAYLSTWSFQTEVLTLIWGKLSNQANIILSVKFVWEYKQNNKQSNGTFSLGINSLPIQINLLKSEDIP